VTVYSNLPEVELFANGVSLGKKEAPDHFFYFDVPNVGETKLEAVAGECRDESTIRKVEEENPDYRLQEEGSIINWFEISMPAGRLSINNKISDIAATFRGKLVLAGLVAKIMRGMKGKGKDKGKKKAAGFEVTPEMMQMLGSFTILRISGMIGMVNVKITKEDLLKLNRKLNRIKLPKKKK
jgi:beta-galactosidase